MSAIDAVGASLSTAERLVVVELVNACGCVLIRTVWDVVADPNGRRVTRSETISTELLFKKRIAELGDLLWASADLDQRAAKEAMAAAA